MFLHSDARASFATAGTSLSSLAGETAEGYLARRCWNSSDRRIPLRDQAKCFDAEWAATATAPSCFVGCRLRFRLIANLNDRISRIVIDIRFNTCNSPATTE